MTPKLQPLWGCFHGAEFCELRDVAQGGAEGLDAVTEKGREIIKCSLVCVAFGNTFWRKPSVTQPLYSLGDALGMIQNGDIVSVN